MDINPRLLELLTNISDLEETLKSELRYSSEAFNNDDSFEKYLKDQLDFFSLKKESLYRDFNLIKNPSNHPKGYRATLPPPKVENNPRLFKSSSSLNPFKKVQSSKIFSKKVSPARGTSPSALRYSPHSSPSSAKSEKLKYLDLNPNQDSPLASTRSSTSSTVSESKADLYQKYQEQREIRNKAHQEMLALKEQMLLEKELKLEAMMRVAQEEPRKKQFLEVKDEGKTFTGVKPPRSPVFGKGRENDKIVRGI
jgi:hypothetical protein